VKAGKTPKEWQKNRAKNRQKDKDARWTKKHGKSRFRKSAQDDKWSFCLTVGTLCPANQERP
jgi:hypothetical protein